MNPDPDELAAWLRLTGHPAVSPAQWRAALSALGGPQSVLAASIAQLSALIGRDAARAVRAEPDRALSATIESATRWSAQRGHHCISLADRRYPSLLLEIPDPPALLFASGELTLLTEPLLALLVARTPSREGLLNARQFSAALAAHGVVLLLPADSEAQWAGAMKGRLPARSRVVVQREGFALAAEASRSETNGAQLWLSENAPGVRPARARASLPDRLIAGLARAVLVIEAATASAPLSTARLAAECGRDVLAIPGSIHSPLSKGCHRLIKEGAKLVESVADVLEEIKRFRGSDVA